MDLEKLRVLKQHISHRLQHSVRLLDDHCTVGNEVDLLEDHDLVPAVHCLHIVGATRRSAAALSVGTVVIDVGDAIFVVVLFWAAIFVTEAVDVLFAHRTGVVIVVDAVIIVVEFRAAVLVAVPVPVLPLVGAAVVHVGDPVLVVVLVRTAVVVEIAIRVFRIDGTLVVGIKEAIQVVVRLGTAITILVAVSVLCDKWALVGLASDTVPVTIGSGAPRDSRKKPKVRGADAARQAKPAADHYIQTKGRREANVGEGLEGAVGQCFATVVSSGRATLCDDDRTDKFDVDVEPLVDRGDAGAGRKHEFITRIHRAADDCAIGLEAIADVGGPVKDLPATRKRALDPKGGHAVGREQRHTASREGHKGDHGNAHPLLFGHESELARQHEIASRHRTHLGIAGHVVEALALDDSLHKRDGQVHLHPGCKRKAGPQVPGDDAVHHPGLAAKGSVRGLQGAMGVTQVEVKARPQPFQHGRVIHRDEAVVPGGGYEALDVQRSFGLGNRSGRCCEQQQDTEQNKSSQHQLPLP